MGWELEIEDLVSVMMFFWGVRPTSVFGAASVQGISVIMRSRRRSHNLGGKSLIIILQRSECVLYQAVLVRTAFGKLRIPPCSFLASIFRRYQLSDSNLRLFLQNWFGSNDSINGPRHITRLAMRKCLCYPPTLANPCLQLQDLLDFLI